MSDSNSYGSSAGAQQPDPSSLWSQQPYPEQGPAQPNPHQSYPQQSYPQYGADPQYGSQPGTAQSPAYPQSSYSQPSYDQQPYGQQPYGQPYAQDPPGQAAASYGQPGVPYVQPGAPYGQPVAPGERKWSGLAIAGFLVALIILIISLFSGWVFAAVLPIALCARGLADIKRNNKKGKVLAIIGFVLTGISLILYIVNIIGS